MHLLEVNIPEIHFKSQFSIHGISNSHSSVIAQNKNPSPAPNLLSAVFFQLLVNKSLIRRIQTVRLEWQIHKK